MFRWLIKFKHIENETDIAFELFSSNCQGGTDVTFYPYILATVVINFAVVCTVNKNFFELATQLENHRPAAALKSSFSEKIRELQIEILVLARLC